MTTTPTQHVDQKVCGVAAQMNEVQSKPHSSYLASIFERCLLPGVRPSSPAAAATAGTLRFLESGGAPPLALGLAAVFCFALPVAALPRFPGLLTASAATV